jgi:quercetin dioxygenase-like cupin family protein
VKDVEPVHTFMMNDTKIFVFHADLNEGIVKHAHEYAHITMCNSGSIVVRINEKEVVLDKMSSPVSLPAGQWHEIEALENDTVFVNVFVNTPA